MKPIYLDHMSTTPIDPRVRELMIAYLGGAESNTFGNANSPHYYGYEAKNAIELAREKVASLVHCDPLGIVWTSGATEANNLAIKGIANFYQRQGRHIITSTIEHKSVIECCQYLATQGFEISYLKPSSDGLIDPMQLEKLIRRDTILISLMHANNEIGTIQKIEKIGAIAQARGVLFHVDAAQSAGKIPLDLKKWPIDLMSFSAHKIYGPKGIGALYIRTNPRLHLVPLLHGGTQENSRRAGTLATHQIVGMGEAFSIAQRQMHEDGLRQQYLIEKLKNALNDIGNVSINGSTKHRLPHNLNLSFADLDHELLVGALKDLAISTTSACYASPSHVRTNQKSYVLKAIGLGDDLINNSLRISIGRFTTEAEMEQVIFHLKQTVASLRKNHEK